MLPRSMLSHKSKKENKNKLMGGHFVIRKSLYCNFASLKTSSAKADEILQGK